MNLSDLNAEDIESVTPPITAPVNNTPLKLSDLSSDQVESPDEKYGTAGQQALSALEGGARGLTFGVSDLAEKALLHNAPDIKARMEANPITSTVSQVAGAAAPLIATAGGSAPLEGAASVANFAPSVLASQAGRAIEGAVGGGLTGRVLGLGAEGAIFGAGNAVTDSALGDPKHVSEQVLSDIGMGAAFGGGLGLLSKGVEAVLPAATKKLTGALGNLKESIFGTVEEPSAFSRAISIPGGVATGTNPENWTQTFLQGLNPIDKPSTVRELSNNLQKVFDSSKEAANELSETAAPANIGKALQSMPLEEAKAKGADILNTVARSIEQPGLTGEMVPALSSPTNQGVLSNRLNLLNTEIQTADSAFEVHSALSSFAKDADKLIKFDTLPTASQMADQAVLRNIRNTVRGALKDESLFGEAAQHYAQTSEEYSNYLNAKKNFQSSFMKKEPASKQYFVDPAKVSSFFNRYGEVGQDVRAQYLNDFLNRTQSLSKASENYFGFKAGEQSLSKRVSELAKQNEDLTEVAQALKSKIAGAAGSGSRISELGVGYAAHSLGVPNPVTGAALGAFEAYKAIKNPFELGSNLAAVAQKLQVLGDISESVTNKVSSLAKQVFIAPEGRTLPVTSVFLPGDKSYTKRTERIEQLASHPEALIDHLADSTGELYEAAPNVSGAIHSTMISGVQFLNSKIPRPEKQYLFSPEWEPSRTQKETFNRYYEAVDDPFSVLKQVRHGTLTNESMQALQTVYPKLLTQMQQAITENLTTKKGKILSYPTKIALSKFLGQPLDEALQSGPFQANQLALQGAETPHPQNNPQLPGKSTLGGLKQLTVASRAATETEQEREVGS